MSQQGRLCGTSAAAGHAAAGCSVLSLAEMANPAAALTLQRPSSLPQPLAQGGDGMPPAAGSGTGGPVSPDPAAAPALRRVSSTPCGTQPSGGSHDSATPSLDAVSAASDTPAGAATPPGRKAGQMASAQSKAGLPGCHLSGMDSSGSELASASRATAGSGGLPDAVPSGRDKSSLLDPSPLERAPPARSAAGQPHKQAAATAFPAETAPAEVVLAALARRERQQGSLAEQADAGAAPLPALPGGDSPPLPDGGGTPASLASVSLLSVQLRGSASNSAAASRDNSVRSSRRCAAGGGGGSMGWLGMLCGLLPALPACLRRLALPSCRPWQ
jgi:hypothetical protein